MTAHPTQVTSATAPHNGWCGAFSVTMPSAAGCASSPAPTPAHDDEGSGWASWEWALVAGGVLCALCVLFAVTQRQRRRRKRDRRLQTESLLDGYLIGNLEDGSDDFLQVGS